MCAVTILLQYVGCRCHEAARWARAAFVMTGAGYFYTNHITLTCSLFCITLPSCGTLNPFTQNYHKNVVQKEQIANGLKWLSVYFSVSPCFPKSITDCQIKRNQILRENKKRFPPPCIRGCL